MTQSPTSAAPAEPGEPARPSDWKKRAAYALLIIILIIIILLLRSCFWKQAPAPVPFNYFHAKAEELRYNPTAVTSFVRDQVTTLSYRGDVKGALATLWNGAGSPEEKKALADALMAYVQPPKTLTLDDVAPTRDKATDASPDVAAAFNLKIVHRIYKQADADEKSPVDTPIYDGPVGALVGDVHSIEVTAPLHTRITLRGDKGLARDVSYPADAVTEQIVFTYRHPVILQPPEIVDAGSPQPAPPAADKTAAAAPIEVVVRELWHDGNRVGANHAQIGDRHDFVVLPARIGKFVREKEQLILKQQHREEAPEAKDYLILLDYAAQSDKMLASLEKHRKLAGQYDQPRVLMLSRFVDSGAAEGFAWALDLRANRVSFIGQKVDVYLATQARSFMEAGLEQQFLSDRTGLPSRSTFDVFSRLKDEYPNTCARRLSVIHDIVSELQSFSAVNASATFSVHVNPPPPGANVPTPSYPSVTVTHGANGRLHLKGGAVRPEFARKLAATPGAIAIPVVNGAFEGDFDKVDDLAVAVETALLSSNVTPGVTPNYVLDSAVNRGPEPLVEPGARFIFAWGEGDSRTDQDILVTDSTSSLVFKWRVQTAALPATGLRTIVGAALGDSTVHNPWYRAGGNRQEGVTSFCVSRKVYAAMKAGHPIDLSVQARYGPNEDDTKPRKIEFTAPLTPIGPATIEILINGRKTPVSILRCKLRDSEVAILDDPTYPVGMADKLTAVTTCIRGRLVDDTGVPIGGVRLKFTSQTNVSPLPQLTAAVTTAADGTFRLRPPTDVEGARSSYGKVNIEVTQGDQDPTDMEADLTAPGLEVVTLTLKRPRPTLVYISQNNAGVLDGLRLSDQVKRNARRDLAADRLVVIPNEMLSDGLQRVTGYFACDRATGYYVGVTEDGLNGSSEWKQATLTAVKDAFDAREKLLMDPHEGASAPFHMYRGVVMSWWVYCTDRLAGDSNKQALCDTLAAMQGWAKATDLSNGFGNGIEAILGKNKLSDELTSKFKSLINSGIVQAQGDSANAAFEIGYVSGTAGLAALIGDDDSD